MELELRLLRHALALSTERNFVRAARKVGLTQPAMTRSIQELERRLGFQLFVRDRRGIQTTDAANVFLASAAEVVARAEDLAREATVLQGLDVEALTIGAGPYPAEMLVGRALARTLRAHAGLRVRILVDGYPALANALRRRDCDFVVAERMAPEDEELESRALRNHQGYFVVRAGHPLLGLEKPGLGDVLAHPLATTGRLPPRVVKPLVASLPRRVRAELGKKPFPSIECLSLSMLKHTVAGCDAVGLFSLSFIAAELASGELEVVDLVEPWLHTNFAVSWPRRRALPPSAVDFVNHIAAVDAEQLALEESLAAGLRSEPRRSPRAQRTARLKPSVSAPRQA